MTDIDLEAHLGGRRPGEVLKMHFMVAMPALLMIWRNRTKVPIVRMGWEEVRKER